MSRSGYHDDLDNWAMIQWRGQVMSSIKGKRGQKLLRDLIEALDGIPDKRLITSALKDEKGEVCALGAVFKRRGISLGEPDEYDFDPELVASQLDVAEQLVREIAYENDQGGWRETPEYRWSRLKRWAELNLKTETKEIES